MQVTTDLLESLGCGDTPIITVLNKCDLLDETMLAQDFKACVRISAKNGTGIDELLNAIEDNLPVRMKRVKFFCRLHRQVLQTKSATKALSFMKNMLPKDFRLRLLLTKHFMLNLQNMNVNNLKFI